MHRLCSVAEMGLDPTLPERPSGMGGLQAALPGQGKVLGEGESGFRELQSEPAELKGRKGAEGPAAAPAGLCQPRSPRSQPADLLQEEPPAGTGREGVA